LNTDFVIAWKLFSGKGFSWEESPQQWLHVFFFPVRSANYPTPKIAKVNVKVNREVKHDVYGRRQTAKITSDFLFFSCNP